jgi:hypothetical protein
MKIRLNDKIGLDLSKLIESRLLVQANSGGGKSWAIRRIIEQAFGQVQIIVLDPEGEFTNLREEYDFVFAGKGGDAPAEPRSAALLARRLLEVNASAIVDLYELNPQERKHFVRLFCDAMVNAPKELWHDCLVIIDEAHVFAPEKGESEAMGPVIDLATRGRKRGYCVVLATQRLPKLAKDAAAECNNKLIGRASQDIDRKRAAEELGFTSREQILSLRDLEPGEFYVFGPAISRDVIKTQIGDVRVKPPKRGELKSAPPPPTAKVRKILAQLADLPKEAAEEARTLAEQKAEISRLRRELVAKPAQKEVQTKIERVEVPVVAKDTLQGIKAAETSLRKLLHAMTEVLPKAQESLDKLTAEIARANGASRAAPQIARPIPIVKPAPAPTRPIRAEKIDGGDGSLTGPEQRILNAIAWMESIGIGEPEQAAVAFLAGYTVGGGGFNNPKGALRTKGLIDYVPGNKVRITDTGRSTASPPTATLTTEQLHAKVLSILPGPEKRILQPLLERHPNSVHGEELASLAGYTFGSGGFNNPKGRLRSLGLIEYLPGGTVRARDILFVD